MNWRKHWFDFGEVTYLNAAWQGPLPRRAAQAVKIALEWKKYPFQIPNLAYFHLADQARDRIGRLIGENADDIALTTGASSGFAIVAHGLDWKPDDEVLVAQGDFQAHLATWVPLARAGRLRLKTVVPSQEFISAEDFLGAISPKTRMVSVSLVQPYDGTLVDVRDLARACHERGAYLLLDVSQCLGAMPFNPSELGADFVTCAGYKWLLGPYGTGFFWLRHELIPILRASPAYWCAMEAARTSQIWNEDVRVLPTASRWDSAETASFLNLSGFVASLDLLLEAGPKRVWEHSRELVAHMINGMPSHKFRLASPEDSNRRGVFACIKGVTPETTAALYDRLSRSNINISMRSGALRISPHLYNTVDDIDRLLAVISESAAGGSGTS
jgi:cysteine desulfurase / selenocysteine lyase